MGHRPVLVTDPHERIAREFAGWVLRDVDVEALRDVSRYLRADDFASPAYGRIYQAALDLMELEGENGEGLRSTDLYAVLTTSADPFSASDLLDIEVGTPRVIAVQDSARYLVEDSVRRRVEAWAYRFEALGTGLALEELEQARLEFHAMHVPLVEAGSPYKGGRMVIHLHPAKPWQEILLPPPVTARGPAPVRLDDREQDAAEWTALALVLQHPEVGAGMLERAEVLTEELTDQDAKAVLGAMYQIAGREQPVTVNGVNRQMKANGTITGDPDEQYRNLSMLETLGSDLTWPIPPPDQALHRVRRLVFQRSMDRAVADMRKAAGSDATEATVVAQVAYSRADRAAIAARRLHYGDPARAKPDSPPPARGLQQHRPEGPRRAA